MEPNQYIRIKVSVLKF